MKYNFMEFLMKCNYYRVSDKIIATMNTMMKAIKYNVNIAIVDKLFFYVDNLFYWIDMYIVNYTVFIELRERCYASFKIVQL